MRRWRTVSGSHHLERSSEPSPTRLAIDELRSARARRERYVGEWLPEPILTDERNDPARQAEIADSLSVAMAPTP